MKKIFLSFLLFSFAISTTAQDIKKEDVYKSPKHYVGIHAGFTTGYGLSYRYWPTKLGVQITASPFFDSNDEYRVSTGLSLLYTLKENKFFSLYGYFGNHFIFENGYKQFDGENGNYINKKVKTTTYNLAIGGGIKVNFLKELDGNFQIGYGVYDATNNGIVSRPTAEIGIYYHF